MKLLSFLIICLLSFNLFAEAPKSQTVVLAGGCFWGMEEVFRKIPGVLSTQVGYSGG